VKDRFGRQITYLRLSVIESCNLHCKYCMPDEGPGAAAHDDLLTAEEIERVVRAAAQVGVQKVRLTGGEPTLRRDIVEIVRRLVAVEGMRELVMTTNGTRLSRLAGALADAGLRRVNVHIDSLDESHLASLSGSVCLGGVWRGIEAAERAGLVPIKLNTVVVRGFNETDVVEIARLTMERSWHVRFIEMMPLGQPAGFALERYVSNLETQHRIEAELGELIPLHGGDLVGEARLYRLNGGRGDLGFISPVSHAYCDRCNHLRVTADGRVRPCLLSDDELDLRRLLRAGGTVAELAELLRLAIAHKPQASRLKEGEFPSARPMAGIGG
jgi:cyclic pyranopterin phosphate synthase